MTIVIKYTSNVLGEDFTFIMPEDGGYIRVCDSQGEFSQIFKSNGSAITALDISGMRRKARNYIKRCESIAQREL